jgi:hypothetical protein
MFRNFRNALRGDARRRSGYAYRCDDVTVFIENRSTDTTSPKLDLLIVDGVPAASYPFQK